MKNPGSIVMALVAELVERDCGRTAVPELYVGVGLMRGIELAVRHPEYAHALHISLNEKHVTRNDGSIDHFVAAHPLEMAR